MSRSKEKHREYMRQWRLTRMASNRVVATDTGIVSDKQVSQDSQDDQQTVTLGNQQNVTLRSAYKSPDLPLVVYLVNDSERARRVLISLGYKEL